MIRPLAAAAAFATLAVSAGAASAQTYGQPIYLNAYGRPVGGSPLSEVETRAYIETGRWADGYSDRPYVHVPAPGDDRGSRQYRDHGRQGQGYGYRYGHGYDRRYDREYRGYGHRRYDPPSHAGYRDEWGYNDDRPPSARRWSDDPRYSRYDRDCGCGDVYLYDR